MTGSLDQLSASSHLTTHTHYVTLASSPLQMPQSSASDTASMQNLLGEGAADEEGGAGKEQEGTTEERRSKASKADVSKSTSVTAVAPDKCVSVCCVCIPCNVM